MAGASPAETQAADRRYAASSLSLISVKNEAGAPRAARHFHHDRQHLDDRKGRRSAS